MPNKINILGTEYEIIFETKEENEQLLECKGYADFSTKEIHINKETYDWYGLGWKTLKHEIVHCFIFESGLWNNCSWADNEELTDWIAIQTPKISECFKSLIIQEAEADINNFIQKVDESCPDILCEDCTKEDCTVKKLELVSTKEIKENE